MKIIVLGAGLVGGPMAVDLATDRSFEVTAVDVNAKAVGALKTKHSGISTIEADLSDPEAVTSLVADHDLVLNAVPGFMGFRTLEAVLKAKKNVVDISFFPEDPFGLDQLSKEMGVTAVIDCGVAPGLSNLLVGHVDARLDETRNILIYVGGLPVIREWPFEYKAGFSPIDVIEEYTRPARYVENGAMVTRVALSDPELIDFPGVGTLEAFNTDGLRTLATTLDAPNMKEKTLRYAGHIDKMAVLRDLGMFDEQEVRVNGSMVRPIDVTTALLFPKWKLEEGEADLTVMQVVVEGRSDGKEVREVYDLLDKYDERSRTHSMARTTGYTATVAVRMLAQGLYDRPGISPPEFIGKHEDCVAFMLAGLESRGIRLEHRIEVS
jgi:saccharopine dehydrogenase-like NADP-dependent oxidoreductase